jgi:hypothetical protein
MRGGRRFSDKWYANLWQYMILMLSSYMVYERIAPVVTDFEISHSIQTEESIIIYGTFNKVRNCRFQSLFVTTRIDGIDYKLDFEFTDIANKPSENHATRLSAKQFYGPWTIDIIEGADNLTIRSLHACDFGAYRASTLIKDYVL